MLKERKILVIIVLLAVAAVCMGLFFRGRKYEVLSSSKAEMLSAPTEFKLPDSGNSNYVEHEVVCRVDSEEEAERVAEAVNGSLKSWQEGIAVIEIQETVQEFLKKYQGAKDLPAMYPNYIYSIKY